MPNPRGLAELADRLTALPQMELVPLQAEWRRLYQAAPPARLSRDLLACFIADKLQQAAHGGLPSAARRRLAALMQTSAEDVSIPPPPTASLRSGSMLVRSWRGQTHTVHVLAEGFEHAGQRYRSLSHVARTITGAHWSGPRFFGLTGSAGAGAPNAG